MEKMLILNNEGANFEIDIKAGEINFNLEAVKDLIKKELVPYEVGQVTEFKEAKKELAKLRKLQKGIEETRTKLKNQWLMNFQPLENELKALSSMIDPAIKNMDSQVKEEEAKEKAAKELQIFEFIKNIKKDNMLITLEEIPFNSKWLNKTYKLKDIETEIWDIVNGYIEIEELKANQKKYYRVLKFPELTLEQMQIMKKCFDENGIIFETLEKFNKN